MSIPSRFRFHSLLVLLVLVSIVATQYGTRAAILTRAIEAQKSLVEREEQVLQEAKDQVYRTAQNAIDVSRDAVSNVADQLRYVVTYPWRVASEALEKPKLYAKYMLNKASNAMNGGGDEATPIPVALSNEYTSQEPQPTDTEMLPQWFMGLRSLFNTEPAEPNKDLPKPSPFIEVIEIKQKPSETLVPLSSDSELDTKPEKEVIQL
ncbi:uncharacterized protein LOC128715252 [Anopheles marshallii]|uniref:uncharacterized protein LOC128715252 n=1 Tax=Anopheles marshallii TaxID=1521116 RepID=UPI00237C4661|nr:uncharacterized protein LOC128715252 [Anopheles marshallii]